MQSEKEPNTYMDELKKFIKSEATVSYIKGDKLTEVTGTVKAINFNYLHIVIITEEEKILIKNFVDIRRKRKGEAK